MDSNNDHSWSQNEISTVLRHKGYVFRALFLFTAVINLLMLVPSVYMMQVYDRVLLSRNMSTLLMLTLITVGLYLLMSLLEYIRSMVVIRMSNSLDRQLSLRIYTAAWQRELEKSLPGKGGEALNDLTTLRQFITGSSLFAFLDAPWFPIYLLVIFLFNFWIGMLALTGVILLVGLAIINNLISQKPLNDASQFLALSKQEATNCLRNSGTTQAMGMLSGLRQRWMALHLRFLENQSLASQRAACVASLSKGARLSLQSLVLGLGAWLAVDGQITSGMMIAGSILMGRVLAPVEQVINAWKSWRAARMAWQRLGVLLATYPAIPQKLALPPPKGHLTVENIRSKAVNSEGSAILRDIAFGLVAGEVLGIVGASAAGKSSLMRAIAGIAPLSAGKIRLDGVDLNQWERDSIGPFIGYLPQETELFNGTIAENIARFGKIDTDLLLRAARLADVHELILRQPQGYDTTISLAGKNLSGGQMQRIGLARAVYGDPVLVLLDEPDASLDDAGVKALMQAILHLKKSQKTVLLITHRPALLAVTDKLLFMVNGSVKAFGATPPAPSQTKVSQSSEPVAAQGVAQ